MTSYDGCDVFCPAASSSSCTSPSSASPPPSSSSCGVPGFHTSKSSSNLHQRGTRLLSDSTHHTSALQRHHHHHHPHGMHAQNSHAPQSYYYTLERGWKGTRLSTRTPCSCCGVVNDSRACAARPVHVHVVELRRDVAFASCSVQLSAMTCTVHSPFCADVAVLVFYS